MRAGWIFFAALVVGGCAAQPGKPAANLTDTYWRVAEIDGKPITIRPGTREPHIVLRREASRISGFAGCNNLGGAFQQEGATLRIGDKGLAMTRMACVGDEGNALETAFTNALTSTASYRITGDRLELRDAAGAVRMTFEARGAATAVK